MDIRKQIIILCLLCCHALCAMAVDQIVFNYKPISREKAMKYFGFFESSITVTGVSYGSYKPVSKNLWIAHPTASKTLCFALKVECSELFSFTFDVDENVPSQTIPNEPSYEHTLIVDGQTKVVTKIQNKNIPEKISCELSAGKHEIVFMSSFIDSYNQPTFFMLKNLCLHAHDMVIYSRRSPYCGQNGYVKSSCRSYLCDFKTEDVLPMQAQKHKLKTRIVSKGTCLYPTLLFDECGTCGLSLCNGQPRKIYEHKFENGRCVNGCGLKFPVQNADSIYQVCDAYELRGLAEQIQAEKISRACNIDLTADIIYPEDLEHVPIGDYDHPFAGTFDGHGHRIVNMRTPSNKTCTGLFGAVMGSPGHLAVIANVIIDSTSTLKGDYAGAIAGRADYCDIVRCVSNATVIGNNSNTGGIVGTSSRDCHLIDCAMLGNFRSAAGGLFAGSLRRGYIMDSYCSSYNDLSTNTNLVSTDDCVLRHSFQIDAKDTITGVTSFSSTQMSDGTLARMLCEKNGKDMPAHWMQDAATGCPMPVFTPLTNRPAATIQPKALQTTMSASSVNSYGDDDHNYVDVQEEDSLWFTFSPESELEEETIVEDSVFYAGVDSTQNDYTRYVTTTFRNVPAMPMFAAMEGGDATECDVIDCKRDSSVILKYKYTIDGKRYSLADVTKYYTTPDSLVHVERYDLNGNEQDGEFLMTNNMVFFPDYSGYEEDVSLGVVTRVMDWEVTQDEGTEPKLNFYSYDEEGQQRIDLYSISLSRNEDDILLPVDIDYTLDENDNLMDIHYLFTDSITGEKYNIGGEYYIYDEQGELVQEVSYEPVKPFSREMRQTEYKIIRSFNDKDNPTSIIPIEHLQPNTLAGTPARTSTHVYDMHGNLIRLSNDAAALKSLPKGIYITRGKKIMVR